MSKNNSNHIFTSESVSEGHPDKVADQISDAILDACLQQDSESRVACETLCTTNFVLVAGEITTTAEVDYEKIVRQTIREIGYTEPGLGFDDKCEVVVKIHRQSADISLGVTASTNSAKEQGAGDQGMMFGYATDETEEYMPAPIMFARRITKRLAELRHRYPEKYPFLRPDAKSQVSVRYIDGIPQKIESVVVSHQHTPDAKIEDLTALVKNVVKEVIPERLLDGDIVYYINPTGRFEIGGPNGDTGLTGRKIIVDTYGGVGSHGGGAFSGKDPSKVDRSAAYMARYIAKNLVATGEIKKCEVQIAYAIGVAEPVSLAVDTFGTGKRDNSIYEKAVRELFKLCPKDIVNRFGLKNSRGWSYLQTARFGHFGEECYPWEKLDKVQEIKDFLSR